MKRAGRQETRHLTDGEFFSLALPPAGQPEALPEHLSECLACTRALAEWKTAVRELAHEDAGPILSRSAPQWAAAEERALAAVRRVRLPRPRARLRWALASAAALLLAALLVVTVRRSDHPGARTTAAASAEWSAQDQADDALLRDVARLSRGEEGGGWNTLAPDPKAGSSKEEL